MPRPVANHPAAARPVAASPTSLPLTPPLLHAAVIAVSLTAALPHRPPHGVRARPAVTAPPCLRSSCCSRPTLPPLVLPLPPHPASARLAAAAPPCLRLSCRCRLASARLAAAPPCLHSSCRWRMPLSSPFVLPRSAFRHRAPLPLVAAVHPAACLGRACFTFRVSRGCLRRLSADPGAASSALVKALFSMSAAPASSSHRRRPSSHLPSASPLRPVLLHAVPDPTPSAAPASLWVIAGLQVKVPLRPSSATLIPGALEPTPPAPALPSHHPRLYVALAPLTALSRCPECAQPASTCLAAVRRQPSTKGSRTVDQPSHLALPLERSARIDSLADSMPGSVDLSSHRPCLTQPERRAASSLPLGVTRFLSHAGPSGSLCSTTTPAGTRSANPSNGSHLHQEAFGCRLRLETHHVFRVNRRPPLEASGGAEQGELSRDPPTAAITGDDGRDLRQLTPTAYLVVVSTSRYMTLHGHVDASALRVDPGRRWLLRTSRTRLGLPHHPYPFVRGDRSRAERRKGIPHRSASRVHRSPATTEFNL
ncbi:hypothetical protein L083_8203 [Actinoplanes sp. N902-109]|nr:hypothetical protein L083_8203 [Actinoplanes sp. N902-109]